VREKTYVLHSYALLAYLQAERGSEKVRELLRRARAGEVSVVMSTINLGEVLYTVARKLGDDAAAEALDDMLRLPVELADATMDRVLAAAQIKAHHAVSYADCFAVSLAKELEASVVTGDPEFRKVETLVPLVWL
jgi:predicted nucleic acid-binding protein